MKPLVIAALLTLAAAGATMAQQTSGGVFALPPAERFTATDTNKDGKVTKDEFLAVIQPDAKPFIDNIWDNRDANKDGWLTAAEMNANGAGRGGLGGGAAGRGGAAAASAGAAAAGRGGPPQAPAPAPAAK